MTINCESDYSNIEADIPAAPRATDIVSRFGSQPSGIVYDRLTKVPIKSALHVEASTFRGAGPSGITYIRNGQVIIQP